MHGTSMTREGVARQLAEHKKDNQYIKTTGRIYGAGKRRRRRACLVLRAVDADM